MDEKLILNDGTEIVGHMFEVNGRGLLYLYQITLAEAFELLNDPEKTEKITEVKNGVETTVSGYNHLTAISEETGGMINAVLMKV